MYYSPMFRRLRGYSTLRGSSPISTLKISTTSTLQLSVSNLKITMKMSGSSAGLYSIYASTVPFGQQGGNPGSFVTDPATGITGPTLAQGTYWNAPHWGTAYYFTVVIYGTNTVIATASISTPDYIPGAPKIASASGAPNSISLSWDAVANASSYNVYVDGTLYGNTQQTSMTIGNLSPATEYTIGLQTVAPDVV